MNRVITMLVILFVSGLAASASPLLAQGSIDLIAPADGETYDACSALHPPTFQWSASGTFKSIEVQLSTDGFAGPPLLRLKAKKGISQAAVKASQWKKVLLRAGSEIGWRVAGTLPDKSRVLSGTTRTLRIGAAEAPTGLAFTLEQPGGLPQISWENHCCVKFKAWFGNADFKKKKSLSLTLRDPGQDGGSITSGIPAKTWTAIQASVKGGTVYWYLESWDALKRYHRTPGPVLAPAGPAAPPAPILLSPADGATDVALDPGLSWTASVGATSYRLQVAANASFASPVVDLTGLTATSHTAMGLNNDTTYHWRVCAFNGDAISEWSASKRFKTAAAGAGLKLEKYDVGFLSIQKPKGWEVTLRSECDIFGILIRDPGDPLRQIFYFSIIGPVYTTQAQKDFDRYIEENYPGTFPWSDAPVISPLTVENYMNHWPDIAAMKTATQYMAAFPRLSEMKVVSSTPQTSLIQGGETALVRGVFADGDRVGQGQFYATVAQNFLAETANGFIILGATMPMREFDGSIDTLVKCLESLYISQSYVDNCYIVKQQTWAAVGQTGETLRETSDMIYDGWVNRSQTSDILAERGSDSILSLDRVYDPDTGEVYQVPVGWYDSEYLPKQGSFDMGNLQLLPDSDHGLWMALPHDGSQIH